MNLCRECSKDFGGVTGFDAHRQGRHAYSFSQGLDMDPPRENGRRCLDASELTALGWKKDSRGRWRMPPSGVDASVRFTQRPCAPSEVAA